MMLRQQLVRLAHANPELRPDLLPLIRKARVDWDKVDEVVREGLKGLQNLGGMAGKHGDTYGIKGNSMKIRWGRRELVLMEWRPTYQYGKIKGTWGEADYVLLSKATPEKIKSFVKRVKDSPTTKELRQQERDKRASRIQRVVKASQVGKTIIEQMGGMRRLQGFLGVKYVWYLPNGVRFQWPNRTRTKGNVVQITLRSDDTYDMEFFNVQGLGDPKSGKGKSVRKYKMLYFDDLVPTFEAQTGWMLRI